MTVTPRSLIQRLSLLWAVLVPIVSFAGAAAVMSIPVDTQGVDVMAGRELFRANCGACHFAKMGFPAHHGPNLHDIGRTGAHRKSSMSAPEYLLESILDPEAFIAPGSRPGMPNNIAGQLSPEEIRNIIGFLASCDARPDFRSIKHLSIPDRRVLQGQTVRIDRDQMALALRVMHEKGSCFDCHALHSTPNDRIVAPALFNAGLSDRQAVHLSIVQPNEKINPPYQSVTVERQDGVTISGQLLHQDEHEVLLRLRNEHGKIQQLSIPMTDIEHTDGKPQVHVLPTSFMPSGFDKLLTPEEIEAIESIIHQLN